MPEIPLEITQIREHLRSRFTGKLPEATSKSDTDREANFLSRALAAFAVLTLAECSEDQAATAVIDGGQDGGIDAIHYSEAAHCLWIIQSKFQQNGQGQPDLAGVLKFKAGIENLLRGEFSVFAKNKGWQRILPKLTDIFDDRSLKIHAVIVYSGAHIVSDDRKIYLEDVKQRFSSDSDYLRFHLCNLKTVHNWVIGSDISLGVDEVKLTIKNPGVVDSPYKIIYGLVPLHELVTYFRVHGKKLIEANIRAYKGSTSVNKQIMKTVQDEPEHFVYLNNGLTAYCQNIYIENVDRDNVSQKRIRASRFSIVNGAQTIGSITAAIPEGDDMTPKGYAFIKIISLENSDNEREFAKRITQSTNLQNQIGSRDFVALDEQQENIANLLGYSSIVYLYKDDVNAPDLDENTFSFDEAITACACLPGSNDYDYCATVISNRKSLWSMEIIYPDDPIAKSKYARVFSPERSARTIWRAVQVQRIVAKALRSSEAGVRREFYTYCRWIVLNALFVKCTPHVGENLMLTSEEAIQLTTKAQEYAEALWEVSRAQGLVTIQASGGWEAPRTFRSIFGSVSDCQILRRELLSRLSRPITTKLSTTSHTTM